MIDLENNFFDTHKAFLTCDLNGNLTKANLPAVGLLGILGDGLKNLNIFNFFEMNSFQARTLNENTFVSFETKINFDKIKKHNFYETTKSGISFFKIKIKLQKNSEYLIELDDITSQFFRKLELELHNVKEDCKVISENVADMISRHTLAGDYIYVSDICKNMLGYTPEELRGRYSYELINPDDYEVVKNNHIKILNFPVISTVIYRIIRKDGKYIWVETSSKVIRDEETNRPKEIISISRDITERKKIEKELDNTKKLYKSIIDDLTEGICRFLPDGTITFVNLSYSQYFEKKPEELVGKNIFELNNQMNFDLIDSYINSFTFENSINSSEKHINKNGKDYWFDKTVRAIFDKEGKIIEFQSVNRDITELKKSQIELQKAKEEALSMAIRKTEFLTTMSHEIRNPMNAVIGMTELLMNTKLTEEQEKYLETIKISGKALLNIINDVLDFSKIESGKMTLKKQSFDLRKCIENVFDFVSSKTLEKKLELFYFVEKDIPEFIFTDEMKLRQILLNLVSNAVKFTEKGNIYLSVSLLKDKNNNLELLFSVTDTGIGIPSDRIKDLFQNYTQIDSPITKKYEGTGLGLVISKKLVEIMDGNIWVESQENKGSKFFFTIKTKKIKNNNKIYKDDSFEIIKDKKVLIVDNNETNLEMLSNLCKSWGMIPIPMSSKNEILELANIKGSFDVAVLDYNFSKSESLKLCDSGVENNFSIVVITNLHKKEIKKLKTKNLCCSFISKPIKHSLLFNTFVNLFSGKRVKEKISEKLSSIIIDRELSKHFPLNILVAEDNEINQDLMLLIFEKMGYKVDSAFNGLEVLDALKQKEYDIIFMDINMPKMNGFEATKEIIKNYSEDIKPKIIALTASAMHEDEKKCLEMGMDDYLSKPVSVEEIENIIKKWGRALKKINSNNKKLEEEIEKIEIFDPSFFKKMINLDEDENSGFFITFIDKFIEQSNDLIDEINKSYEKKDFEKVGKLAHKLKGSSLTIGANKIGNLCNSLILEYKNNQLDNHHFLIKELELDYKKLNKEITEFKNSLIKK